MVNNNKRFNLIAQDRDDVLTIEVIGETYLLRRKPHEILSNPILKQGFTAEQLLLIEYLAKNSIGKMFLKNSQTYK